MNFYRSLILLFIITIITQYFTQQKVNAYPSCDRSQSVVHSREQLEKISYWTDYFFEQVRPEMRGKKIQLSQTIYRREKTAIRQVIRSILLCTCYLEPNNYFFVKHKGELTEKDDEWVRDNNYFLNGFYHDLTDAIFYARHPEITKRQSKLKDMNLATEWMFIRQYFVDFERSEILSKAFIPVCDRLIDVSKVNRDSLSR